VSRSEQCDVTCLAFAPPNSVDRNRRQQRPKQRNALFNGSAAYYAETKTKRSVKSSANPAKDNDDFCASFTPEFARRLTDELPFLRQLVRRWHRDRARAEDLVQDTIVQALANARLWQPGSNLRAWLTTIMRNQFLAALAKAKRSAELLETISQASDHPCPNASEGRLLLRDVERALRKMPPKQCAVLVAIGIEGKSYEQTALQFGLSVGAVRCHLARGRETLRDMIEGRRLTDRSVPRSSAKLPFLFVFSRVATPGVLIGAD
jgi:RNA polymerase sigma-70 factor, ECF subfamily